ncbi:MAG: hypothetical protein IT357_08990 [Gemmatimonadaceae bacterium]|nr:hypothetical protein [Gemmatimonadaceae bacterium]
MALSSSPSARRRRLWRASFAKVVLLATYLSGCGAPKDRGGVPPGVDVGSWEPGKGVLDPAEVAVVDSLMSDLTLPGTDAYGSPLDTLDRRALQRWIRAGHVDSAGAVLAARWAATQSDIMNEMQLYNAYESLFVRSSAIEGGLLRWVVSQPQRVEPYAALAYYHYGRAYEWRTGKAIRDVKPERLVEMRKHAALSRAYADSALRLEPTHLIAHYLRINISRLAGRDTMEIRQTVTDAVAAQPQSFLIWNDVIGLLEPRWGGSYEAMDAVAQAAQQHADANPRLRVLLGRVALDRANVAMFDRDRDRAMELWAEARGYGEDYFVALGLSEIHHRFNEYAPALRAAYAARRHLPQGRSAMGLRAHMLTEVGALTADSTLRHRVWEQANDELRAIAAMMVPLEDPATDLAKLAHARTWCSRFAAPCMEVPR